MKKRLKGWTKKIKRGTKISRKNINNDSFYFPVASIYQAIAKTETGKPCSFTQSSIGLIHVWLGLVWFGFMIYQPLLII